MNALPWHILGAGSIGCLFAAYLRRAGHPVTLILRDDESVARFRAQGGIRLHAPAQNNSGQLTELIPTEALGIAALNAPVSRLLICTKAHQTLSAVRSALPALAADAQLVLLQNGMGVREMLQAELPRAIIANAITTEGAWRRGPFDVIHAGRGTTRLGIPGQPQPSGSMATALSCALDIQADADIAMSQWRKLAINCVINPLTALRERRNGELPNEPDIGTLVHALCAEIDMVANAAGVQLRAEELARASFEVMYGTAANQSSMWQDLQHRRRTEIDFINGYVVAEAARRHIPCPANQSLLDAIKDKEARLGCV